mgnify:CR=1 FL=1
MSFIPNTTPTPNWLYNGEMKKMSDTELRVVLIVTRHTLGWIENEETGMRKQEDWISHSSLIKETGRGSRAISSAIDKCVKHGWIETRDSKGKILETANERRRRRIFYRLGNIFTDKLKSTAKRNVDRNLPHFATKSTALNDRIYRRNDGIQKKPVLKKIDKSDFSLKNDADIRNYCQ